MIISNSYKSHRNIPNRRKPLSSASEGNMLLTTVLPPDKDSRGTRV